MEKRELCSQIRLNSKELRGYGYKIGIMRERESG
jgi:hypothetical protein